MKRITLPLRKEDAQALRAGESVLLSGELLTARDAAHARLCDMLSRGEPLPVDFSGATLYYTGPCPAPEGWAVGPCGPTTGGRMDAYTPQMLEQGVAGIIAKGYRSPAVLETMKQKGVVYFAAIGGAGALIGKCVKACECLAFSDLGTEAIYRFVVEDFPVVVVFDTEGNDLYTQGPAQYKK